MKWISMKEVAQAGERERERAGSSEGKWNRGCGRYMGQPRQTRTTSSANSKKSQQKHANGRQYTLRFKWIPGFVPIDLAPLSRLLQRGPAKSTCRQFGLKSMCECVCESQQKKCWQTARSGDFSLPLSFSALSVYFQFQFSLLWLLLLCFFSQLSLWPRSYRKLAPKMPPPPPLASWGPSRLKQRRNFCLSSRISGESFWPAAKTTRRANKMNRKIERARRKGKGKVSGGNGQWQAGRGWLGWLRPVRPLLLITFDRLKVVLGIVSSDSLRFRVEAVGFCFWYLSLLSWFLCGLSSWLLSSDRVCGRKGVAADAVVIIVAASIGLVNFVCKLFGLCPNIDNILMSMARAHTHTLSENSG